MLLLWPLVQAQYGVAQAQQAKAATALQPGIVQYTPGLKTESLAGRPETDLIRFSNGRQMTLKELRQWEAAAKILRTPRVDRTPAALKIKAASTGTPVRNSAELANALKTMHDNDTVRLPSGKLVTVGMIRFMQPAIETKLGRKLDVVPQNANLSGTAIKITASTDKAAWQSILQKPDNTVIEGTRQGVRITVGQLKQYLGASTPGRAGALLQRTAAPSSSPQTGPKSTSTPPAGQTRRPQ